LGSGGETPVLFCECGKIITDFDKLLCKDCLNKATDPKCEGFLYRKKKTINCYWMCIDKKELYCYEKKESTAHKCMHNLIGCFIKEEEAEKLEDDTIYYPFSLIFSAKKMKKYYCKQMDDFKMWTDAIKKVIGYANLLDYYDMKVSNLRIINRKI
jgi:hypothetical protein